MDTILSNLTQLKGVHNVFIYKENKKLYSTFNLEHDDSMVETGKIIEQIFSALRATEQSHNEIYFSLPNYLFIVYMIQHQTIIGLLTEKKINYPLIHMGVKTAERKLMMKKSLQATPNRPSSFKEDRPNTNQNITLPLIDSYKNKLSDLLINFLGPAAPIVIEDSLYKWKNQYSQTPNHIPQLITLIAKELDSEKEKQSFAKQALLVLASFHNND